MIHPATVLLLAGILFAIGLAILLGRRHPLTTLLGIELLLQAVNVALAAWTRWFHGWDGEIAIVTIAMIAAAELAVGLGAALTYSQHISTSHEQRSSGENKA